jgi:hypothetical protein
MPSLQEWRKWVVLGTAPPVVCADLGYNVLDAALVEVAAYCLEKNTDTASALFFKVLGENDKPQALRQLISAERSVRAQSSFCVVLKDFGAIPGSPFAYSAPHSLRECYRRHVPFESAGRTAKQGLVTGDDFRLVRAWWEPGTESIGKGWFSFAKGGASAPYYADLALLVEYGRAGQQAIMQSGRYGRGADYYYAPGLTWPHRSSRLSAAALPAGSLFSQSGKAAFAKADELPCLLALLNSSIVTRLARLQSDAVRLKFEVGLIQKLPVPRELPADGKCELADLASRIWNLKRSLDTTKETSHAFVLPLGLTEKLTGLNREAIEHEIDAIQKQIDERAYNLYGIGAADRAAIETSSAGVATAAIAEEADDDDHDDDAPEDETLVGAGVDALRSWLVGVAFGRFDPRLATGDRAIPPTPKPFDPLPPRSPGMWPEGEQPRDTSDILIDDEGHADDIVARVQGLADRVDVDLPENLRAWIAKEFFPLHIKMYSKSRRKAPIYWQLAMPSASYSVWVYIHAFSKDTLFRVQNDYVATKLAHEERRLESLARELHDSATAAQRKALAAQEAFVEELRTFLDEVKRIAPLWNPNLDDGVVINFAPLWRLVPQNKSWQKELKSTWDALCAGRYDWAHLALHLWPERVVPKCAKDRSLAIAHGLEDVFWAEGTDGKWTARKAPTGSVDALVRERTSHAVKSALKSLLEAPTTTGKSAGRGGNGRKTAAAVEGDA